jgi:hypothetical protein
MNKSIRTLKKASATSTIFFMLVSPLYSFVPVAAYADEVITPANSTVSADSPAPADQVSAPVDTPADAPAPSDEPVSTPAPEVTPDAIVSSTPSDSPVPEVTPVPSTPTNTEDSVWQILPNGKAVTTSAVNMTDTYVAPQNSNVTVRFTELPDTAGNLTIQEIKLTADQQKQLGALSDTAYDISSNMQNGTFKYNLTLPNPSGVKTITVKYAENMSGLADAQVVTQKQSQDDNNIITVTGLNHFTIFTLSADTNGATGTGVYTSISNQVITEASAGQISTGAIVLTIPAGFNFKTTASSVTATVTPVSCPANKMLTVGTSSGSAAQFITPTSTTISVNVFAKSSGNPSACASTITISGIQVRPTAGTPLASLGALVRSGVSIGAATYNADSLQEGSGAISNSVSTLTATPASVPADGSAASTITATVLDQFGNPISGQSVTLSKTAGTGTPIITTSPATTNASGIATFTVKSTTPAIDTFTASGSTYSKTVDVTFTAVDTTAPAIPTLVSPADNAVIQPSAATLDWSDSTDLSSPVTYRYQSSSSNAVGANNGFTSTLYTSGSLATSQIDATGSSEGVYYWEARACDSVGNCSDWSGPWKVTIDNTAPVIAGQSTVTAEATSSSGAVVSYTSPATSDNVDAVGVASCSPAPVTLFPIGDTTVTCNAADTAGNVATSTTFTVTVQDTTAPTITVLGNNPEIVELGGVYTDAGATASDNIDGNITGSIATTGTVNTGIIGTYYMYYDVTDAHGNSATQAVRTVNVVDTTKPNVPSLVSPADNAVIQPSAATLDWSDETDLSNPVTYKYQSSFSSAVGVSNGFNSPIYTSGTLASSQIDATGSADGVYYWQVRACDALNNCSDWSGPWKVTIDGTAPVTTDSGTDTSWHKSDVTVTLACADNLSGCANTYYTTDGSTPTTASSSGTSVVVSTTGVHTIQYFSVDAAGNQESVKTAANTVKIDKVLPGVPVIGAIISPTSNPIVSWTWDAVADVDSGIQHYQYLLLDAASNTIDSGFTTLTTYSHTVLDGAYTFFVRAIDNAGNKGPSASSSVTVDTPPVITDVASHVNGNPSQERVITWTTNKDSDSRVVFGTTSVSDTDSTTAGSPNYGYSQSSDQLDISPNGLVTHTVTITGLNSYTTYYFRVISGTLAATVSSENSFGTEATDGTPGPNGDSSGSSGSSDSSSSSSSGKVLGATTKVAVNNGSSGSDAGVTGTPVNVYGGTSGGSGSSGSGSGSVAGATTSPSPSPEVSPSPEPSAMESPTPTPEPTTTKKNSSWPWWYWVLIVLIIGMGYYLFKNRKGNNDESN